ncbi:MAG: hypothetical protein ACE5II_02335 [Anaerolineae bacterium]
MNVEQRLAKWATVEMTYDARGLPGRDKRFLQKLIEASRYMDEAFWRQSWSGAVEVRDRLQASGNAKGLLRLVGIMVGPYDRLEEFEPFLDVPPKPLGAGFYPDDLTREEFERYLARHPEQKEALLSPYTVVKREGDSLIAVPYHQEYREFVEPISRLLKEAAELTDNRSLKRYLASRAQALLTDDYYQSDIDWINLEDNDYDIVIGPYEFYEDRLMGVKAAYEATVGIVDREESHNLEVYTQYLDDLERSLPYPEKYKRSVEGLKSPFVVVRDIYRGGEIRAGIQATAANLPNDPRVHTQYGTKKTFWKNMIEAYLKQISFAVARELIVPGQFELLPQEPDINLTLFHEIAHALGPCWVMQVDGSRIPISEALKDRLSPLEEGKADVVGLYCLGYLMGEGVIPREREREYYVRDLATNLRGLRYGLAQAHALGRMCQVNYHLESRAIFYDEASGRFGVDFDKIASSVADLAEIVLTLEATGDYEGTGEFFQKHGRMPEIVRKALGRTEHIPVSLEPVYKVWWE